MIISNQSHLDNEYSPESESSKPRKQRKPRKQQKPSELETTRQRIRETPGMGIHDVATEWTNALTRDALKGNHHKAKGRSSVEKIKSQIAKTNSHAKVRGLIIGESLILSAFASRQDFEKQIRSVVYDQCSDNPFLLTSNPNWRKHPRSPWERITPQERFAWVVSAVMQGRRSKQYTAISLNLSKEDAAKSPAELIDTLMNRIERALDCKIMLCVEEDDEGRSHCHGIYFGSLTKEQKKKLKQAGGTWEALDSRHQRHTVERRGMEDAIGWDWYLHKNAGDNEAEIRIPNELRALGRAHYDRVMDLLLPHFIADRDARHHNHRPTPDQTEPLDKNESHLSTPEKVSGAISNFDEDNHTSGIAQEGQSDDVQATSILEMPTYATMEKESLQSSPIASELTDVQKVELTDAAKRFEAACEFEREEYEWRCLQRDQRLSDAEFATWLDAELRELDEPRYKQWKQPQSDTQLDALLENLDNWVAQQVESPATPANSPM